MKENKLTNTQTFFKSFVNNRILFERRKNSILYPILILILIILLLSVPQYFASNSIDKNQLAKNFPKIENAIGEILTSDLDCSVKNATFTCKENELSLNKVVGDEIKYTILVNESTISLDTNVTYNSPKDTDNLIVLHSQTIRIRYIQRDHVNQKVILYEIIGDYSNAENFNLKETTQKIANNPDVLDEEVKNFILQTYKSTLDTQLIVNLSSSIVSFLLLVLVTCIVLKSTFLFKLKKGFKFSECFKISLTSALPSIVICLLISIILGFGSFSSLFGFFFVGRILFIYFKYILNNRIFKELYEEEKEERFNIC